jgi:hypothetical protein
MSDRSSELSGNVITERLTRVEKALIILLSIAKTDDDSEILQAKFQCTEGDDDLTLSSKRLLMTILCGLDDANCDDFHEINPTWFIAYTLWELLGTQPIQMIACLPVR